MTAPDFSKNPYGQAPPPGYGDAPSSPPGYGQSPPPGYGQAPPPGYGYGAPQAPYGQAPYGQAPYGQAPYGQAPYGQAPYGVAGVQKPTGWFVVNWLFFWPLAIYSLVSAWGNIDRALFAGDLAGAQYHANRVRKFGIIALCIGIGWIALWIIISVAVAGSASSSYCSGYNC